MSEFLICEAKNWDLIRSIAEVIAKNIFITRDTLEKNIHDLESNHFSKNWVASTDFGFFRKMVAFQVVDIFSSISRAMKMFFAITSAIDLSRFQFLASQIKNSDIYLEKKIR